MPACAAECSATTQRGLPLQANGFIDTYTRMVARRSRRFRTAPPPRGDLLEYRPNYLGSTRGAPPALVSVLLTEPRRRGAGQRALPRGRIVQSLRRNA